MDVKFYKFNTFSYLLDNKYIVYKYITIIQSNNLNIVMERNTETNRQFMPIGENVNNEKGNLDNNFQNKERQALYGIPYGNRFDNMIIPTIPLIRQNIPENANNESQEEEEENQSDQGPKAILDKDNYLYEIYKNKKNEPAKKPDEGGFYKDIVEENEAEHAIQEKKDYYKDQFLVLVSKHTNIN